MKCLSIYTMIGLVFLSSTQGVAQVGSGANTASGGGVPVIEAGTPADRADIPVGSEGYVPEKPRLAIVKSENDLKTQCPNLMPLIDADIKSIKKEFATYEKSQKTCRSKEERTNTFCISARNPDIRNYTLVAQTLMAGVAGMADACSRFGKLMDLGNKALTAYQAQCSLWRGMCSSSCSEATEAMQAAKEKVTELGKKIGVEGKKVAAQYRLAKDERYAQSCNATASSSNEIAQQLITQNIDPELATNGDYRAVAMKLKTCESYAKELATSTIGIMSMVKSMGEANDCKDDSSNTGIASATPVDCSIAANKQNNMTCICQDAPRTPGCEGGLDNALGAKSADSLRSASTSDYVPTTGTGNIDIGDGGGGTDLASKGTDGSSGSSLPGGPMGGGPGGLGGSGGFGGGVGKGQAAQKSGLNTNILGGEGGGGGGGSWGGGGYNDPSLRQYLPGGKKDPTLNVAGQAAVSKEVTSPGGKSNWEKVRERYRDNKPSLLGY